MKRTETVVSASSMSGESTGATSNGESTTQGRFPANLIHDGSQEVLDLFPSAGKDSAARFFYCAKASKKDRDEGNNHPTVKPTALMSYLCRLITPTGGVVLDPYMGSGSTGKAAVREGFSFVGCELDKDYFEIATARINYED
jgi:site-specific DNA-methyltransferase (adenine-specific)